MSDYIVLLNECAADSLYTWRPIHFADTQQEAVWRAMWPRRELQRGDMTAVIHADHASDIVPNLFSLGVCNDDGEIKLLRSIHSEFPPWLKGNWITMFSGCTHGDYLWRVFGCLENDAAIACVADCFKLIDDPISMALLWILPHTSSLTFHSKNPPSDDYFNSAILRL